VTAAVLGSIHQRRNDYQGKRYAVLRRRVQGFMERQCLSRAEKNRCGLLKRFAARREKTDRSG